MITVIPCNSKKEISQFIRLPHDIYRDCSYYAPPLNTEIRELMNPTKHPFHQHGKVVHFLAYQAGKIVGRIAAIKNDAHNAYYHDKVGFFGLFECINDQDVANALLDKASEWVKKQGLTILRGPMNYSYTETQALLIDGFDSVSAALLTYNPPYYKTLLETYGLEKQIDLYAFTCPLSNVPVEKAEKLINRVNKQGITLRQFNPKNKELDSSKLFEIVNVFEPVNTDNYYPVSEEKGRYIMRQLSFVANWNLVTFAEKGPQVLGFACAIPDYHLYFKDIHKGRLFPDGLIQLAKLKLFPPKRFKFMLLGLTENKKRSALAPALVEHTVINALKAGYESMDMSLIHENNEEMLRLCENFGGCRYKTYRVYEKSVSLQPKKQIRS